jgi:AraC family transcriptional regulator of adaptative response/methylated-DNA-[protein]-cysteine methyltransferase
MGPQEILNYDRIANAIHFINDNFKEQPSLDEIAEYVSLSPFHFQRMFKEWAGVSPKKFLQYTSIEHAKKVLEQDSSTLFDATLETGLSGTGRLHDLFIRIEGMTPGEYKNGGANLAINYSFATSPFGKICIGSTGKGICHLTFITSEEEGLTDLKQRFPNAVYRYGADKAQVNALKIFSRDWDTSSRIKLHLKGTDFQIKVWESLLKIPQGNLTTYGAVAGALQSPGASRAVGSAIGRNPVAFLIPCHRVIRATGNIGEYHWGSSRKTAMLGWEAARAYAV